MTRWKSLPGQKALSPAEEDFALQLKAVKLTAEREFTFNPPRKWRFDFAFPEWKVAVEIEGGIYANGRHNRPSGFIADMTKYNTASILGWRCLRYPPEKIKSGEALVEVLGLLAILKHPNLSPLSTELST